MSNVIPILSSSPPPIDDPPSFNDGWDGFKGAAPVSSNSPIADNIPGQGSPIPAQPPPPTQSLPLKTDQKPSINEDVDDWADFSGSVAPPPVVDGEFVAFPSVGNQTGPSSSITNPGGSLQGGELSPDSLPDSNRLALDLQQTTDRTVAHGDRSQTSRLKPSTSGPEEGKSKIQVHSNTEPHDSSERSQNDRGSKLDTEENKGQTDSHDSTSQESVTDSGLCSDISPVPKNGEYSEFSDNKSSEVEYSDEGAMNLPVSSKTGSDPDEGCANLASVSTDENVSDEEKIEPEPIFFRETVMGEIEEDEFDHFKCVPGLESDSITPTQSQFESDNISTNSPSPYPPSSPEDEEKREFPSNEQSGLDRVDSVENNDDQPLDMETGHSVDLEITADNTQIVDDPSLNNIPLKTNSLSFGQEIDSGISKDEKTTNPNDDKEDDWEFQDAVSFPNNETNENWDKEVDDDVNFNDFADAGNNDGEFGDFASLSTTQTENLTFRDGPKSDSDNNKDNVSDSQKSAENDDDDDDWAFQGGNGNDFASTNSARGGFADFGDSGGGSVSKGGVGESDWAAFSESSQVVTPVDDDDDDDDFGDFDDAKPVSFQPKTQPIIFSQGRLPIQLTVDNLFSPSIIEDSLPVVEVLYHHMTRQILREEQPPVTQKQQSGRHQIMKSVSTDLNVWNNLRDLDKTAALKYTWDKSNNNGFLLRSLSIDTRNILIGHKKSSVPIFASNLGVGVLEPSREPPEVGREGRVSEGAGNISPLVSKPRLTAGTPQDIPPAEFDWSSAGLTNPLDSLENELLKSIEPEQSKKPKTLEPLENYLANLKVTSTAHPSLGKENDVDQLSEPAYTMVSQLPDLSFMRAKMLMFPVKCNAD